MEKNLIIMPRDEKKAQIVRMETSNCFEESISINLHWNISELIIFLFYFILLLKKVFKKVKCSVKWAFHLITCLPNTLKKNTDYVRVLYAKFLYVVKRVDHMGVLSCSQTWEWGQLYVLQVHNCPLCIRYTLHKVVSRLACSNYVRFFCCGRFLTGGFCCSHPMGTRVIDMGTNKYIVTCAYCPLFPWITQNNMDLMASGPTRPVPYITFFFSWSYNPVNDNNFWYITEGKNKTKKKPCQRSHPRYLT